MVSPLPPPSDLLENGALFLDFDGTLIELADSPDTIKVPAGLAPMLERLRRRLDGRLAIVSGRSLADLERHLPLHGTAFSGSHGLELRLADGTRLPLSVPIGLKTSASGSRPAPPAPACSSRRSRRDRLHYRLAPRKARAPTRSWRRWPRSAASRCSAARWCRAAADRGDQGRCAEGVHDGTGLRRARPLFMGDDLTDEHGFAAAAGLGGAGILVGPERDSAALYRLGSVSEAARWLDAAA